MNLAFSSHHVSGLVAVSLAAPPGTLPAHTRVVDPAVAGIVQQLAPQATMRPSRAGEQARADLDALITTAENRLHRTDECGGA